MDGRGDGLSRAHTSSQTAAEQEMREPLIAVPRSRKKLEAPARPLQRSSHSPLRGSTQIAPLIRPQKLSLHTGEKKSGIGGDGLSTFVEGGCNQCAWNQLMEGT